MQLHLQYISILFLYLQYSLDSKLISSHSCPGNTPNANDLNYAVQTMFDFLLYKLCAFCHKEYIHTQRRNYTTKMECSCFPLLYINWQITPLIASHNEIDSLMWNKFLTRSWRIYWTCTCKWNIHIHVLRKSKLQIRYRRIYAYISRL